MELGERIAVLREERALTQAELAERARISASTLSQIESGKVPRPHVGTVRKIARALGVEPMMLRRTEEPATAGKAEAPREAGQPLKVSKLPGLDATLRRRGVGRGELAYRVGMTPGELFDYEIGAKKPDEKTVARLADALDCFEAELVFEPDQAERFLEEDQQQNAVIRNKADEWLQEMREDLLRNPDHRRTDERMKEAYRKEEERRLRESEQRKDNTAS